MNGYGLINAAWKAAGHNAHGHHIGCLCEDMTTHADAAKALCEELFAALEAESDWTGDAGAGECGRIDDHDGQAIYWWHNNATSEWTSDKPGWWIEAATRASAEDG